MPISQITSASIAANTITSDDMSSTAQYYGFKNRIINGDMSIAQRGTSFTNVGSGAGPQYTLDRWFGYRQAFASNQDVTRQTGFSGFSNCIRMQRTSGTTATQGMQVSQIIETLNCADLAGQTVTVSAYIRAGANFSGTGTFSIIVATATSANATSAQLAGGGVWNTAGSLIPTISTTGAQYSFSVAIPAGAQSVGVQFFIGSFSGTAGAADFVEFTGVQLEKGSVATSFDFRPIGTELMLCQRYLPIINGNTGERFYGVANTTSNCYVSFNYEVEPRVPPTGITVSSVSNFSLFNNRANAGTVAPSNIYFAVAGKMTALLGVTVTGLVANDNLHFYPNSTSAQIRFEGCEL